MRVLLSALLLVVMSTQSVWSKTNQQAQWIDLKVVSDNRSVVRLCSPFACEILGSSVGYTAHEIQDILDLNSSRIRTLGRDKWILGAGLVIVTVALARFGSIMGTTGAATLSLPLMQKLDEKIRVLQTLEARPQILSQQNFEVSSDVFIVLVQALRLAIESYDKNLEFEQQMIKTPFGPFTGMP